MDKAVEYGSIAACETIFLPSMADSPEFRDEVDTLLALWNDPQQVAEVTASAFVARLGGNDAAMATVANHLFDRNETMLARALLAVFLTHHKGFWSERAGAMAAMRAGALDEAAARMNVLCQQYPQEPAAFSTQLDFLLKHRCHAEARQLAIEIEQRFSSDLWCMHFAATQAEQEQNWMVAAARWSLLLRQHPEHQLARAALAQIFIRLQQPELVTELIHGRVPSLPVAPVSDVHYRCPTDLQVSPTLLRRALVIGSCLSSGFVDVIQQAEPACSCDFMLVNNMAVLPDQPPHPVDTYDFQFVQIPIRVIMPEYLYLNLDDADESAYAAFFDDCRQRLRARLDQYLKWNRSHGLTSFVANFLVPQQNTRGRLQWQYDLRNLAHFVARLNEALSMELRSFQNCYLLNIDEIAASLGRRYIQEDMLWLIGHGAALSDDDHALDQERMEPTARPSSYYPTRLRPFMEAIWLELIAMLRTARQTDMVKLVLLDLDDTLWRGVLAESGSTDVSGWPMGLVEALALIKQRGVLLGIVSKNTEANIERLWPYKSLLPLDQFAVKRINWQAKAQNIAEILGEVNLLPANVVFIDDNPVERAAVAQAFPTLRILGATPYLWRRILLWSAETQVAVITQESRQRTELIKAQVEREQARDALPREEFLASLSIRVRLTAVRHSSETHFARAFELLNKTNQFNTTGQRWTPGEANQFFAQGGVWYVLHVEDRFTAYGLVGVLCVHGQKITQFVLSCRVIGLDVELAALEIVLAQMREGGMQCARAAAVSTATNLLSRDIWQRTGFSDTGEGWTRTLSAPYPTLPAHITHEATASVGAFGDA